MRIQISRSLVLIVAGFAAAGSLSAGTYKHIVIDGAFDDWAGVTPGYTVETPNGTNSVAYKQVYVANDDDYLYLRYKLFTPGDPFTSHENIFIDADANLGTGFSAAGGRVGSEMLIQGGAAYQEKNGGFNEGGIDNLGWQSAPAAPADDFEVRISRHAVYALDQAPVFTLDSIAILLEAEDSTWTPVEFAPFDPGGLAYTFELPPPVLTTNQVLIALSEASWNVNAAGTDLGTDWRDPSYDDTQAGWTTGQALFGYTPTPGAYPAIKTPLAAGQTTTYFRTRFPWNNDITNVVFVVTNYLSDGAVYYLNGAEVKRVRMPTGAVSFATPATANAAPAGSVDLLAIAGAALVNGENVLAVETHQAPNSAADMVFGLSLTAAAQFPVTVLDPTLPEDRTVVAGTATTFRANVIGSGPLSYQWLKDNNPVPNATNALLTIAAVLADDAGAYALKVTNPLSTQTTRAAVLAVSQSPVVLTDIAQPADQTVVEGNPVLFSVAADGSAPIQYQWYKGTDPISAATNATFSIATAAQSDTGLYHVLVSNPASSTNSRSASLTVVADKTPPSLSSLDGTPNSVTVTFSEPVDPATANLTANYKLSGGVTVSGASLSSSDPAQVTLTTSQQVLGTTYALTVNGVKDRFGNTVPADATRSFLSTAMIDGQFTDWQGMTPLYSGASMDPTATDFKDIYVFNDADYLYMRVTTWAPTTLQIGYNNFFFDTDNDPATGLSGWGGAEMLIQGGNGYQEKNGGFNEGAVSNVDWLCAPAGEGTDFEFRVSLRATYESDGKPVFTTNVVNFAIDAENTSWQSVNRAPDVGVLSYTLLESPAQPPGPLSVGYQGTQLLIRWDGSGTLQSTESLSAPNWTAIPSATSPYPVNTSAATRQFYRLAR